ncbi:MAG: CopD family protein [Opitutales bacterium]|jgi:putative copper resistance protein D
MTTEWFVLARAVHFGACLLLFGFCAFDRFVASAVRRERAEGSRLGWWCLALLVAAMASGLAWFALATISMSGGPLGLDVLGVVWNQTQFGALAKWRLLLWLVTAAGAVSLAGCTMKARRRDKLVWFELLGSGLLLGSLAWAGHGLVGQPAQWHLAADVLHLLAAGLWPAGLLPLALRFRELKRVSGPERGIMPGALVRRFSAVSLGSVAALAATGFVNACYLVGTWGNLVEKPYGQWLMVKLGLFGGAVALGAVNLLRLKPKLCGQDASAAEKERAAARLEVNVRVELGLGMLIVVVVAVLGMLAPAIG